MTATADTHITLPASAIEDLDPRTLGLFAAFLVLGEGARQEDLATSKGLSAWVVRKAFRELQEKGYLERGYKHEGGRLRGTVWKINLDPRRNPEAAA